MLLAPIFVWFSYYPLLHFGQVAGANIELSLIEIYLVGLVLINLPNIARNFDKLRKNKIVWLIGLAVAWSALSLIWTSNPTRGLLTVGVELVLFGAFLAILSTKRIKLLIPWLIRIYIASAAVMSCLALIQVIYGAWIDVGLCRGCLAAGFGFVRPSLFAIEPQFLGSLLIAPILILAHRLIKDKPNTFNTVCLGLTSLALYLTMSRGAIYALVAGLVVLLVISRSDWRRYWRVLVIIVAGFGVGLIVHGAATQLNPRVSDTFYDSVSKSVNHLSMGVIALPEIAKPAEVAAQPQAMFDGYVAKSTDERVNMVALGAQTWASQPKNILFGVGTGGSGQSIFDYTKKTGSTAEITQNQYMEVLLENGIIGLALLVAVIIYLFWATRRHKVAWAVTIAFLLQWNMFSGYPNAFHIYLIMAIMLCYDK